MKLVFTDDGEDQFLIIARLLHLKRQGRWRQEENNKEQIASTKSKRKRKKTRREGKKE